MKCTRCGHIWDDDQFIHVRSSSNVTVQNVQVPCQRCGGPARELQSGTFDVSVTGKWTLIGLVKDLRAAPQSDVRDLLVWLEAVQASGKVTVAEAVTSPIPLPPLSDRVLKYARDTSVGVLIYIIVTFVLPMMGAGRAQNITPAQVQQIIQTVESYRNNQEVTAPRSSDRRPGRSPARNQRCPCGSTSKFKKCCGRIETSPTQGDRTPQDQIGPNVR